MARDRRPSPQTAAVLRVLAGQAPRWSHGYESCGKLQLKAGTVYPILIRLAGQDHLESRALQLADVNQVTPIDRSSIVLSVLFAIGLLGETDHLPTRLAGIALIGVGTYLMIERRPVASGPPHKSNWLIFAVGSAVFAALTSILGKVGITDVESNLGTAIRTLVVLVMAWIVAFATGEQRGLRSMNRRDGWFIVASGVATCASWLCYYHALQIGPASLVVPIDKLSIVLTVAFATLFLHERLTGRAALDLAIIVAGTLLMLL